MIEHRNGDSAHGNRVAQLVAELRAELTEAERRLAGAEAIARTHREEVGQLRKAVDALDPPAPAPKRPKAPRAGTSVSRPAQELVDRVLSELVEIGRPTSIPNLAERMPQLSADTVRRSVYALREDGKVRIADRNGHRSSDRYAPMPEIAAAVRGER